jgi:exopolysaccharide biosynthesis polyprenyl glycosylphosphotransferase
MASQTRYYLLKAFKLYDLVSMACAFGLATVLAHPEIHTASLTQFLTLRLEVRNFAIFLLLLLIWHSLFTSFQLYQSRRITTLWNTEALEVLKATGLGTLTIGGLGLLFDIEIITPLFLITFWITSSLFAVLSRLILRYMLKKVRTLGHNLNYVLIVGTNPRALEIAHKIKAKKELGYRFVGFVDDEWFGDNLKQQADHSLVTNLSGIREYLKHHVVDEVIICVPIKSLYDQASLIVEQCEEQGITVRFISDVFKPKTGWSQVGQFEGHHVLTVDTGTLDDHSLHIKRAFDVSASLILLIALSPLLAAIAALIKYTSPSPVFFVQERVGLNKRRFRLYKFRTMVVNAEEKLEELEHLNEISGPVFKINNDPRITSLGRFLRKTSLDELPQLFNVVKGDMSLVGPRPLPIRDYQGFDQDWHRRRLSVPPGITCLWQIQGRNSIPFDRWMELDLEYIDHWSLGLDLKILLKTVPAVLRGSGAS